MKTKMKRQRHPELPRFTVGALAIAGASAAHGATVQITFANNMMSLNSGTTNFVADLTGDGAADVLASVDPSLIYLSNLQGVSYAFASNSSSRNVFLRGGGGWMSDYGRALVPFQFSDDRINGSLVTNGFLEIEAFGSAVGGEASLQIHRLIFDDASTTAPTGVTSETTGLDEWSAVSAVPEASTSLGLLALGAGGLLTRRRLKRAA